MRLLSLTGMRRDEVRDLRWEHVDWRQRLLRMLAERGSDVMWVAVYRDAGAQKWAKTYSNPFGVVYGVAVDQDDNIYYAGHEQPNSDVTVRKFNPVGDTPLWVKKLDIGWTGQSVWAIWLDPQGFVMVTGRQKLGRQIGVGRQVLPRERARCPSRPTALGAPCCLHAIVRRPGDNPARGVLNRPRRVPRRAAGDLVTAENTHYQW